MWRMVGHWSIFILAIVMVVLTIRDPFINSRIKTPRKNNLQNWGQLSDFSIPDFFTIERFILISEFQCFRIKKRLK